LLLDIVGLAALGGLVLFCLWLNESQPFLFRGGFALVALTTAAVIMVVIHPRARLSTSLLEWGPLRWVGVRSYGIYLWHFPVFMVTRPQLDVPLDGLSLLTLRLVVTVLIAGLSYRYVETPIRTGALGRAWGRLREAQGFRRWQLGVRWTGAAVTGIALCVALGVAVVHAQPPAPPSYLSVESVHTEASVTTPETDTETSAVTPETDTGASTVAHDNAADVTEKTAPAVAPAHASAPVGRVTAIGDSVMVGAAGELQRALGNNLDIDAEVGRQAADVIAILRNRRATGQLGDVVVVDIGSNGTFSAEQFDEMMQVLKDVRKVVFVNVKVPRSWEQSNNDVLADGVRRYPNTVLVDWHAASVGRPELFVDDGYHLQPEGQQLYADLIAAQVNGS
jgi:lysophospholipase L1-like esterase